MTRSRSPQRQLMGLVIKEPYAVGSKSEHEGVMLLTKEGKFLLRREGYNPFADPELEKYVGRRIRIVGFVSNNTVIFDSVEVLEESPRDFVHRRMREQES